MLLILKRDVGINMSRTKFFDLNHQAMPESRRITPVGDSLTARQLVARAAIDKAMDDRPTFSHLYVANSPYRRELFGFYPAAMGIGRFVLESHVSLLTAPECTDAQCGAVLYDRGFVSVSGMHQRDELKEQDTAYEWIEKTLDRISERTGDHNPLVGRQAGQYLVEMHENGHQFMEEHNQLEVNFALDSSINLGKYE
jgi:hypothetical protein